MSGATTLERVTGADTGQLRAAYGVLHAALTHDDPHNPLRTLPETQVQLTHPNVSRQWELWLMRAGSEPVGALLLALPTLDNLDMLEVDLGVDPAARHRGHGRTLVRHAVARARELGRSRLVCEVGEPMDGPPGRDGRFAAATGAARSLGETRRTLDLTTLAPDRLAALRAEAEAAAVGYHLVGWTGRCPDDLVDGYAALSGHMSTDAPSGSTGLQPEVYDAARIRSREELVARQQRVMVATAAQHGPGGPLVAFTDAATTAHDPGNAFQWDTLVLPGHRGHRLGMLVKLANLDRLLAEAPDARRLHTWNADDNTFMNAINAVLGFVPARRTAVWRLDLAPTEEAVT